MKHFHRALALLPCAALLLALSACSTQGDAVPSSPAASPSGSTGDPNDICMLTAGVPSDFTMFTVNGTPVTAQEYLYWLGYAVTYKDNSAKAFGGTGIDWSATFNEDKISQSEYLKQDARNSAVYYSLVASKSAELGYALTEEETAQLTAAIQTVKDQLGGQEAFDEALRLSCLTEESLFTLNSVPYLYTKLADGLFADRPTEEEIDTYIAENDILYAKHILLLTVDPTTNAPLDEQTIQTKLATAQDLLSQLRASDEPLVLFDELMNSYSEDTGLATNPDGYVFTAGEMVEAFELGTRALEFGQISDIVESSFGYHIILRLDPDTEQTRQSFRVSLMDEQMQTWVREAEIESTDEYSQLDAQSFYNNLVAQQTTGQDTGSSGDSPAA